MTEKQPFFSIVIPTRNRHETLYYAIQTVLQQSFNDYELIICDNDSSQETKEVVDSFDSEKIKYIRSNEAISMTDNWELAVSHAKGKYVTVIADNDGFINDSLKYLYELLNDYEHPDIIRWEKNGYYWPDMNVDHIKRLVLKTNPKEEVLNSHEVISNVINGTASFHILPMIYCSVISSEMINTLRSNTGRVFKSISPDLYSGFTFAHMAKKYISIRTPITINGTSSKSNGYNCMKKNNKISSDYKELNDNSIHVFHLKLPYLKTNYIGVLDSFYRARETLDMQYIYLDEKHAIDKIIETVVVDDDKDILDIKEKCLNAFSYDKNLLNYASNSVENISIKEIVKSKRKLGFYNDVLYLDGEVLNINNIYEASKYMSHFYNYSRVN